MIRSLVLVSFALSILPASLAAQNRVGIMVQSLLGTSAGNVCGFDCTVQGNTAVIPVRAGQATNVYLFGDAGLPAALAVGLGPAMVGCPGIPLPGIRNSLFILPQNLILALAVAPPQNAGRTICPAGGSTVALSQLTVPPSAVGATLTWQGLVFDGGVPAFTRPIETPFR